MANEISVSAGVEVNNGNLIFRPGVTRFNVTQTTAAGPTPGSMTIPTTANGTAVSLAQLTTPGWIEITNLDTTNYIEIGTWDGATFHIIAECLAGEKMVFRASRSLSTMRIMANTASCEVVINAFDK